MKGLSGKRVEIPSMEEIMQERKRLSYRRRYKRVLKSTAYALVVVAAIAVLLATNLLPVLQVSGDSMNPTLQDQDILVLLKTDTLEKGDLCGFYWQNKLLLKRIISISDIPTVAKTSDMANNTKRHFENRVEIYSDNAGREGWKGTYDYTKIGSITKETSDKSGDGYKQNNSTTYAKNKVIWYCIKLNLGSGDVDKTHTLTVVDKIPDGMKLATDNNSLSSYRIAADLDAKPGNKYTGNIKSPSENIYSLVLNGVTYWSIDTSVSGQLTIQVLPNTLKNLIVPSKTTDHYVEIRYALRLDDATAWNERTLEEKTYTNRITQSTALS